MYNILAYNPSSGKTVIVENFIEKKDKEECLRYWTKYGMQNVVYICRHSHITGEREGRAAKEKRDSKPQN